MGTGYIRNDTGDNIADGNVINASDLDGEFDALQSAFDNSTGHTHDGTAAEGAPIEKVGPNQEVVVTATVLRPAANNTIDLGVATSNEFKDLYIDGTAYLDSVDIDGGTIDGLSVLTVDNLSLNGNTITSTDTNGNLNLRANGTGIISVDATDVNFGDSDKATFGDGSDLQIYHDGSHSYVTDQGTGRLYLQGTSNVTLTTADGTAEYANFANGGAASFRYNNGVKLATTNTGISVTGDVDASDDLILSSDSSKITFGADGDVELEHIHNFGLTLKTTGTGDNAFPEFVLQSNEDTIIDGEVIGRIDFDTNSTAGGVSVGAQARITVDATDTYSSTVAGSRMEFYTTESGGALNKAMVIDADQSIRFTGGTDVKLDATNDTLDFPDNFRIMVGTGDDLQIYHNGTNSFIQDSGTGGLTLRSNLLSFQNAAGTETLAQFIEDGGVNLRHNNVTKLSTAATGVSITGGFAATDGSTITVDDNSVALELISTDTDASQGPILRLTRDAVGAASDVIGTIHYYGEDVGGNGTQYAEIKGKIEDATDGAEDGQLVLNTMVSGTIRSRLNFYSTEAVFNDGSQDIDFRVESNGNANMLFVDGGNDRVGIGHATPDGFLHLKNTDSTAYSATATDGQVGVGPTIYLENPANTNTSVGGQILFGMRSTEEQARIGATGGTAPALTFGAGDAERMRITNDGSVGINNASPTVKLDVIGTGRFVKTNNDPNITLETSDTDANAGPLLDFYRNPNQAGADDDLIGRIEFNGLNDASEKTQFATIFTSIQDASDGTEDGSLRIKTMLAGTSRDRITLNATETVINDGAQDLNFRVESDTDTAAFFVNGADGNVGMSVTDPASHIPTSNNTGKRSFVIHQDGGAQFVASRSDTAVAAGDYVGGYLFKTNDVSAVKFGGMIATVDDSSGNANLEFYPVSNSYESSNEGTMQLDDSGDLYLRGGGIKVGRSHGNVYHSTEEAVTIFHAGSGNNDTSTQIASRDGDGADPVFRHQRRGTIKSEIEEDGSFHSAVSSYGGTSDQRLKENIVASGSQWDDIKALQVKKYSMIEDELDAPNMLGVIAQDLQASGMNGLVQQHFKTDTDDNPILDADGNQEEYLSVKYSVLYMKAIKALQEAMAKIEVLETKVAALEAE